MARVVPSNVVAFIRQAFSGLENDPLGQSLTLESSHAPVVGALVAMIDEVPQELLALIQPQEYVEFLASVAVLRTALANWSYGTHSAWQARITRLYGFREHPVV